MRSAPFRRIYASSLCLTAALAAACSGGAAGAARRASAAYDYGLEPRESCASSSGFARPPVDQMLKTPGGVRYQVRSPLNYQPVVAHPALLVFSAAGANAKATEDFTGLTPAATAAGFLVAYVEHRPMTLPNVALLGEVIGDLGSRFCVDAHRIYATGHSDGGTAATALALMPQTRMKIAGIVPSAAGFRAADARDFACRPPTPVMILHSKDDALFPGWGREMAGWWSSCNRCQAVPVPDATTGCLRYTGCAAGSSLTYCEGSGSHTVWPERQAEVVGLFSTQLRNSTPLSPRP
jgi:polyhydroxybutyrate depolymerase